MTTGVHGGCLRNVDATATPTAFVKYLDQLVALEDMRRYERDSYRLVGAREGARLLDIGCGAGDDARARLVGGSGCVVGLDSSARCRARPILFQRLHRLHRRRPQTLTPTRRLIDA